MVMVVVLFMLFVGFIAWMNLTPGHYRYCGHCGTGMASYLTDVQCEDIKHVIPMMQACPPPSNIVLLRTSLLLKLSRLDFNK